MTVGRADAEGGGDLELFGYLSRVARRNHQILAGLDVDEPVEAIRNVAADVCSEARIRGEIELTATSTAPAQQERARRRLRARGSGLLVAHTREIAERVRHWQADATVTFAGDQYPYLSVPMKLADLADPDDRRSLSAAYWHQTEQVTADLALAWSTRRQVAIDLGYCSYSAAYAHWKNLDLTEIAAVARATIAATEQSYRANLMRYLEFYAGVSPAHYHHCDLPRLFRGGHWDEAFPEGSLLPTTTAAASALGLDLTATPGVRLDLEKRAGKSVRPFCVALRVPEEIYLVALPKGGHRDYEEVLHELGHVAHFALADDTMPWELRYLPDDSVAEAVAYLFAGLLYEPEFLVRQLGMTTAAAAQFADYARFLECAMVRRYCAKTLFEIQAHEAGDLASSADLYAWWMREVTGMDAPPDLVLTDTDTGLYAVQYLTAWFLAAHLRERLVADFGSAWFADAAAGSELHRIWTQVNRHTSQTFLAEEVGVGALDWRPLCTSLAARNPGRRHRARG